MKRASDHPFPYGWPGRVCYFRLDLGVPVQLRTRDEFRQAVSNALVGDACIYATWPGQHRTDLFWIDAPERLAEAIGVETAA